MKISENFIKAILENEYGVDYQYVYDHSFLIQYLDKKTSAVHGTSKSRRSLGNIYAVYSLLHFYVIDYYESPDTYRGFNGYNFSTLLEYCKTLYGGVRLQNHPLNNRVNDEFRNKFGREVNDPIINNNGRYLLHIDYLYVDERDISKTCCKIIEKYMELLAEKDKGLTVILEQLKLLDDTSEKKKIVKELLTEDAEARIFEIISYAILKNHYNNIKVYFGYTREAVKGERLQLFKTGRTNANDGGIDFVMRPVGRFFQVTEVNNYAKYLLDIDKVMHFPVTFVIKTKKKKELVQKDLDDYINARASGMVIIEQRYRKAIEEIITINELIEWTDNLDNGDVDGIIRDIDIYYRLEMNMDSEDE